MLRKELAKKAQKILDTFFKRRKYKIDDVLSDSGSFCNVFIAQELDHSGRPIRKVVIKQSENLKEGLEHLLREKEFYQNYVENVRREAPILHQHIVELYDVFEWGEHVYLIMECADGNLEELLKLNYFADEQNIIKLLKHVLRGLSVVEAFKLFHGDLHPRNILYFRSEDLFKLSDFGLVSRWGIPRSKTLGAHSYRAPELELQEREQRKGDIRSDFYAIGAILYFILNKGQPLFLYDDKTEKKSWSIVREKIKKVIGDTINKNLWIKILQKTLHPDPSERYSSCEEFLRDLGETENVVPENIQTWISNILNWLNDVTEYGTHSPTAVDNIIRTRQAIEAYLNEHNLDIPEVIQLDQKIIRKRIQDYIVIWAFVRYDKKIDSDEFRRWLNTHEKERKMFEQLVGKDYWDFTIARAGAWLENYRTKVIHPNLNEVGGIVPRWLKPYIKDIRTHVRPHPRWREWLEEDGWDWLQNVVLRGR